MRLKYQIVRLPLQALSRFHFGEYKIDDNVALGSTSIIAHSDLLFSALVNAYAEKYSDAEDAIVEPVNNGDIKLSSVFYYMKKDDDVIYLLPKPVFLDLYSPRDGQHKKRNRIKFISHKIWQKELNPAVWIDENGEAGSGYKLIQDGEILLTEKEFDIFNFNENSRIFSIKDHPNSPIRKKDVKQSIFYESDLHIGAIPDGEIGMYFLFTSDAAQNIENLKKAISILQYSGIGGSRNIIGRTMKKPLFDGNLEFSGDYLTNLSLIIPETNDELDNIRYFKTLLRGGAKNYLSGSPNAVIRMIEEGALIDNFINGKISEVGQADNYKILRNGKALIIPVNIQKI